VPAGSRALAATLILLSLAGCRSALPPRTVPEGARLDEDQRRAYLRALKERASGDREGAERALAPLLALRPLHVPSHLLRQDIGRSAGRGAALAEEYEAIAAAAPGDASAAVLRARATDHPAEWRIEQYQGAAARDASAPWPRIALAAARADHALELHRLAAERTRAGYPDEGARLRDQARASAERAVTEGQRAAALAPDLAPAHAVLAHARGVAADIAAENDGQRRRLRGAAVEAWDRALALDPGDPRCLLGRALLLRSVESRDSREQAQTDLDAAARLAPRDLAVLCARARNLDDLARRSEAVEAWRAAAEAAPADPEVRTDLGNALGSADRWGDALSEFRRADDGFRASGGPRWKSRRGLATALAQLGLERGEAPLLDEARAQLRAYRDEGGLDRDWEEQMATLLGAEDRPAEPAPAPAPQEP
jgi:tetratricopeptide (TPR) repeat protein